MALDIGPADFAAADRVLINRRRERARRELDSAIEDFGQDQRARYERCAFNETLYADAAADLVKAGELIVRQAEELREALNTPAITGLNLYSEQSPGWLARLLAEAGADASLISGLSVILASIESETV